MSEGWIDGASMDEVMRALRSDQTSACDPWAWCTAVEVTCALISTHSLGLASAPSKEGPASGTYEQLLRALSGSIVRVTPSVEDQRWALRSTKQWANRRYPMIRTVLEKIKAEEISFPNWMDNAIRCAWMEHSARMGGLFDREFITQISSVMGVCVAELEEICQLSSDMKQLHWYVSSQPENDAFRIMRDAFLVSTLIRGRYHDSLANRSIHQIVHHRLRDSVLPRLESRPGKAFEVSNVEWYLSSIAISGALAERTLECRIACWAENTLKLRQLAQAQMIDLSPKEYDGVALASAVDSAAKADVRVHPKHVERWLEMAVSMGVGVLTDLVLKGWVGFGAGVGAAALSQHAQPAKRICRSIYRGPNRLGDLARSGPGRIERHWSK